MKYLIASIFLIASISGRSQWNLQYSSGNNDEYYCIYFLDEYTGWVGGWNGILLKTTDGGSNWYQLNHNLGNAYFESICFINESVGFSSTGTSLLKTTDGGTIWETQILYALSKKITFCDNLHGWSIGDSILRTFDGGDSWFNVDIGIPTSGITDGFFYNCDYGWIVKGGATILRTVNGGTTWDISYGCNGPDYISSVFFINELKGWICKVNGDICRTIDGGNSWSDDFDPGAYNLFSIWFLNDEIGWAGGSPCFYTTDGGLIWTEDISVPGSKVYLFFIDSHIGWLAGKGQIYKTNNGGGLLNVHENNTINFTETYPNPFDNQTRIKYQINDYSFVSVEILNSVGKIVEVLFSGNQPEGIYTIDWEPHNTANGLYYILFTANNQNKITKILKCN